MSRPKPEDYVQPSGALPPQRDKLKNHAMSDSADKAAGSIVTGPLELLPRLKREEIERLLAKSIIIRGAAKGGDSGADGDEPMGFHDAQRLR
jgi:hypothetical protein